MIIVVGISLKLFYCFSWKKFSRIVKTAFYVSSGNVELLQMKKFLQTIFFWNLVFLGAERKTCSLLSNLLRQVFGNCILFFQRNDSKDCFMAEKLFQRCFRCLSENFMQILQSFLAGLSKMQSTCLAEMLEEKNFLRQLILEVRDFWSLSKKLADCCQTFCGRFVEFGLSLSKGFIPGIFLWQKSFFRKYSRCLSEICSFFKNFFQQACQKCILRVRRNF